MRRPIPGSDARTSCLTELYALEACVPFADLNTAHNRFHARLNERHITPLYAPGAYTFTQFIALLWRRGLLEIDGVSFQPNTDAQRTSARGAKRITLSDAGVSALSELTKKAQQLRYL